MAKVKEHHVAYIAKKNRRAAVSAVKNAKRSALAMLKRLRDDVTYEDIMYELYVLEKIAKSLRELDEGKGIPHDEVKKSLSKWLK